MQDNQELQHILDLINQIQETQNNITNLNNQKAQLKSCKKQDEVESKLKKFEELCTDGVIRSLAQVLATIAQIEATEIFAPRATRMAENASYEAAIIREDVIKHPEYYQNMLFKE